MKGSEFVFDYVLLFYCKCHKINPNRGGSYIDSPDWIKNKKATANPINKKNNKCFQYPVTVVLNHEENKKDLLRITKIKPFTNKYNWEGINFPSEKDYLKKIEKKKGTIALNVLHAKKEKVYSDCVSKPNSNHGKQVILSIISNGKKRGAKSEGRLWHYLAVKNL